MSQDNTSTITSDTSSEMVPVESQAQARAQQAQRGGIPGATLEELVTMIEQVRTQTVALANEDLAAIQTRMGHRQRLRYSLSALKRKGRDNDNEDVRKQIKFSGLTALPTNPHRDGLPSTANVGRPTTRR
jgi:hypothetical protein